jgi:NAD(P)-dependent dehydrogenase (short-subunit alcohol dehydrogenase family)
VSGLDGRVAVVTGATRAIGAAIARRLAADGAAVVCAGRSADAGREVADGIVASGGRATFVGCDVSREDDVRRLVDAAVGAYGGLHVIVHNAAAVDQIRSGVERPALDYSTEALDRMVRTCLYGAFWLARYGLGHLREDGGGAFVAISSASAVLASPGMTGYGPAKAALEAFTRQLALDYGPDGVRANVVRLGSMIEVEANRELAHDPRVVAAVRRAQMIDRGGTPDDAASLVAFLVSDEAAFITGAAFPVDGGKTAKASTPDLSADYAARNDAASAADSKA